MATVSEAATGLVTLSGGLVVPLPVLKFVWALEDRGAQFSLDGDEILVRPKGLLTDRDRVAIRSFRQDVLAVLRYQQTGDRQL